MKRVFTTSSDVIHLFAQRSQDEARCNNVFFEGNRIYSYGRHYLLAEFIKNADGEEAILINDTGYSATTSKHIREVTGATRQYRQFFVMQTDPRKVAFQLEHLAERLSKAKKPELYITPAEHLFNQFDTFQQWNGKTNDQESLLKINAIIEVFRGGDYFFYLRANEKRIKEAERLRIKEAKKQFKKELKEFYSYKRDYVYRASGQDFVRISKDGQTVETSQRVSVPVREAKILYDRIQAGKDIKGFQIGHYTVIGINGTLKIGCHEITREEITRFAQSMGW